MKSVEHSNQRILTTAQLAEAYGTDAKHINDNVYNNKDRYVEGVDYFCLEGEDLQKFKIDNPEIFGVVNRINKLYLWTESGALMHAKSLNTDKAWGVYRQLVETYFRYQEQLAQPEPTRHAQPLQGWEPDLTDNPDELTRLIRYEQAKVRFLQEVQIYRKKASPAARPEQKQLGAPTNEKRHTPEYIQEKITQHLTNHGPMTLNTLQGCHMKSHTEIELLRQLNVMEAQHLICSTDTHTNTKKYTLLQNTETQES